VFSIWTCKISRRTDARCQGRQGRFHSHLLWKRRSTAWACPALALTQVLSFKHSLQLLQLWGSGLAFCLMCLDYSSRGVRCNKWVALSKSQRRKIA